MSVPGISTSVLTQQRVSTLMARTLVTVPQATLATDRIARVSVLGDRKEERNKKEGLQ